MFKTIRLITATFIVFTLSSALISAFAQQQKQSYAPRIMALTPEGIEGVTVYVKGDTALVTVGDATLGPMPVAQVPMIPPAAEAVTGSVTMCWLIGSPFQGGQVTQITHSATGPSWASVVGQIHEQWQTLVAAGAYPVACPVVQAGGGH